MPVLPKNPNTRRASVLLAATLGLAPISASALQFDLAGTTFSVGNLVTVGALMRMQDIDSSNIGKSTLNPGICVARVGDDGNSGPGPRGTNTFSGNTCSATGDPDPAQGGVNPNTFFLGQPGSFSPNADNGNLNFDKYDLVHGATKLTTDISFEVFDANVFIRTLALFDAQYDDLTQIHPDTTLQVGREDFSSAGKDVIARELRFLDFFVSRSFEIADRFISVKVGQQVLNWGESGFLLANSLNSINPADQALLRVPGFDVKELQRPLGMVTLNTELTYGLNMELFYGYEWEPISIDPVGSFFSVSDILGEGGTHAMLSFAKAPEDPGQAYTPSGPDDTYQLTTRGTYIPGDNPDDPSYILNSPSSRTLQRNFAEEAAREPDDGGQYGVSLRYFAENLNGGTEFGLYFANYHARVPSVSGFAAQSTCLPDSVTGGLAGALIPIALSCGIDLPLDLTDPVGTIGGLVDLLSSGAQLPLTQDALPLDTANIFVEYPEDIRMYGLSFNTTVSGYALSGEYVWRDNLPIQVHTTDLIFALLQPAFPANDLDLTIATLPGRRTAVPDFIQTNYRGVETQPGQYVRGWEPMGIGQLNLSLLRLLGATENPFGASQMTLLLEMGYTHLPGYPELSEFQANGAGTDTHISAGADGTAGLNPADIRSDINDPSSDSRTFQNGLQNPTAWYDRSGFGTQESYGYRFVTLTRYDNAIFGVNLEFLNAFFHDVEGVGPGLGQNFVEGRKQIISGVRWDYLSKYLGELRYTWFTGGGVRDAQRDRDNLLLWLGYQF